MKHATDELVDAVRAGVSDGTLDCVVRGKTTNDGKPARECPSIIGNPSQMCAGCRIRVMAGVPRRANRPGEAA